MRMCICFVNFTRCRKGFALSLGQTEAVTNLAAAELDNLTILQIGGDTLASQLVDRLEEAKARVVRSPDIPEAVDLGPRVVIVFGGEWFEQRVYDARLNDFLDLALSRGAKLVMAGGTTFKFFEALDKAGIYEIPVTETGEVRNPAHDNPPLVGLKMKTEGGHTAPSLFFSYGTTPDVLEEGLAGWLWLAASTAFATLLLAICHSL